jgi:hypothetical protein
MQASRGFCSIEQDADAAVGSRKTDNDPGLTAELGASLSAQFSKLKSGSQLDIQTLNLHNHFRPRNFPN